MKLSSIESPKHVVCIGGGHVNCQVLKILRTSLPPKTKLTLLSEYPYSYYSGMLPGAVSSLYKPEQIQIDLSPLSIFCGAQFIQDKVSFIDATASTLQLTKSKHKIHYDYLAINIGSKTKGTYSVPGVSQYALTTRPIDQLIPKIIKIENSLVERGIIPNVLVVGGGAAGVELSFGFKKRWSQLFKTQINVELLISQKNILAQRSIALRKLIYTKLKEKGIKLHQNVQVVKVEEDGTVIAKDGRKFSNESNVVIWATGPEPQELTIKTKGLDISKQGYFRVNSKMQSTSASNVFAGGDCVTMQQFQNDQGPIFPSKAGVYAVRAGPIIAKNLSAAVKSNYPQYQQESKLVQYIPQKQFLSLMMTGDGKAIGTKFDIAFSGRWVWMMKDWIDRGFMQLFYSHCLFVDYANQGTKQPNHDNLTLFEGEEDSKEQQKKKIAQAKERALKYSIQQAAQLLKQDEEKLQFFDQLYIVDRMTKDDDFRNQISKCLNQQ